MDGTAGDHLADGTRPLDVTGIDDHSRFCVCAAVVARATAKRVCDALLGAMEAHGVPEAILSDNGKVFTTALERPRPGPLRPDLPGQRKSIPIVDRLTGRGDACRAGARGTAVWAMLEVLNDGATVTDVAGRYGVGRQAGANLAASHGDGGLVDHNSHPEASRSETGPPYLNA